MPSFGPLPIDAPANTLCSAMPIGMSLRMKKRTQNAFGVAGTASILYALPDVPVSLLADFTRSDEVPEFFYGRVDREVAGPFAGRRALTM